MAGQHPRILAGLEATPRCGAASRCGTFCLAPAIAGARRCRMHGGKGSGAPKGNRNAQKHGAYNAKVRAIRATRRVLEEAMGLLIEEVGIVS